jgi:Secretion system C-terminal sorting domain
MKNILTLIMCFVLVGGTAFSRINPNQKIDTNPMPRPQENSLLDFEKIETLGIESYIKDRKSSLQGNANFIYDVTDARFTHTTTSTPIVFNSEDGKTYMVATQIRRDGGDLAGSNVLVFTSEDFGASWSQPDLYKSPNETANVTSADDVYVWPNIGFANIGGTPVTLVGATVARKTPDPNNQGEFVYPWWGNTYFLNYQGLDGIYLHPPDEKDRIVSPEGENQYFFTQNATTNLDPDNGGFYFAGGTLPAETNSQSGYYGAVYVNFEDNTLGSFRQIAPSAMYASNFFLGDEKNQSYSSPMDIDTDENGNIYVAVNNSFADDNSLSVRRVGFSKSADGGETWSDMIVTPDKAYEQYAIDYGLNAVDGLQTINQEVYQATSLVVTGEDQFSFFMSSWANLVDDDGDGQLDDYSKNEIHIVEVKYDKGNWSIVKVANAMSNDNMKYFWERMPRDRGNNPWIHATDYAIITSLEGSTKFEGNVNLTRALVPVMHGLGMEINAALTADGNDIIVKWVTLNDNPISLDEPFTYYQPTTTQGLPDTVAVETNEWRVNDIYIANRKIDGGSWETVNATNDDKHYKFTKMPKLVPNLNNIPIVASMSDISSSVYYWNLSISAPGTKQLPDPILQTVYNGFMMTLWGLNLDAGPASAEDDLIISSLDLKVSPNPAISDNVTISFSIETPVRTTIKLSDAMGREIETIMDREMLSGSQSRTVNIDNLSSGAYYITLTVGERSITKLLNITK